MSLQKLRRAVLIGLVVVTAGLVAFAGLSAFRLWNAWRGIDRLELDVEAGRELLPEVQATLPPPEPVGAATTPPVADAASAVREESERAAGLAVMEMSEDEIDVFLVVGSDADKSSARLERADAILLFLQPRGDAAPLLTSLPRDLHLPNRCTGDFARLSVALEGCRDQVSGPGLLALTVEDFTGLHVDHFVVLSFEAFITVIDRLGGIRICLDHPFRVQRDRQNVVLSAGCSLRSGEEALHWTRNRVPEEFVDGEWRPAAGGDIARAERQQLLLIELLRRAKRFRSPLEIAALVEDLTDAFTLDDHLTLGRAIDLAWDLRSTDPGSIRRPTLDIVEAVTSEGEFVRIPGQSFAEMVIAAYAEP